MTQRRFACLTSPAISEGAPVALFRPEKINSIIAKVLKVVGQAQDVGHAVGHFAGAGFEDASAADPIVGAEAKPIGEGFGAAELFRARR